MRYLLSQKMSNSSALSLLAGLILTVACPSAVSADLVTNGNFETVGPNGPQTFHNGISSLGWSAADQWAVFHNANGSTETNWGTYDDFDLPVIDGSQDPFTDHVIRAEVSHAGNGLVTWWGPLGSGPPNATASVWVYVRGPGQVSVGIGNGGMTSVGALTQTINQWELLTFTNNFSPVNEFVIYANSSGAEFYVDFASATGVPEPASAGVGGLGLVTLALFRRRRKTSPQNPV